VNFVNSYLKEYQKEFYCNVLESFQDQLQECVMKNGGPLKKN